MSQFGLCCGRLFGGASSRSVCFRLSLGSILYVIPWQHPVGVETCTRIQDMTCVTCLRFRVRVWQNTAQKWSTQNTARVRALLATRKTRYESGHHLPRWCLLVVLPPRTEPSAAPLLVPLVLWCLPPSSLRSWVSKDARGDLVEWWNEGMKCGR